MADSVGALRVDLSANSAQFGRDMAAARAHLSSTGSSFAAFGGIAGTTGEKLSKGLKRGVNDFRELGSAMGLVGGEFGKLGATIADFALSGFSPLSLAIAGIGFALGGLSKKSETTFTKGIPAQVDASVQAARSAFEELRRLRVSQSAEDSGSPERVAQLEEQISRLQRRAEDLHVGDNREAMFVEIEALKEQLRLENEKLGLERSRKNTLDVVERLNRRITAEMEEQAQAATTTGSALGDAMLSVKKGTDAQFRNMEASGKDAAAGLERAFEKIPKLYDDHAAAAMDADEIRRAFHLDSPTDKADAVVPPEVIERTRSFRTELEDMRVEMRKVDELGVGMAHRLTDGLSSDVAGALTAVANGTTNVKSAFKQLSRSVITDLTFMTIKAVAFQAIMAAIGGAAPTATGSLKGVAGNNYGTMETAYAGGALKRAGADVVVEMHDHVGVQKSAQMSRDPDGRRRLKVMISEAAAEDVMAGGPLSQAIERAHGAPRMPTRRRG